MKTIQKDEHIFQVDAEKTKAYYMTHSLCDCDACRNFYTQIHGKYPQLEAFLAELGVDIAKPDEMPWWDVKDKIDYNPCYTVTGTIENLGKYEIDFDSVNVVVSKGENPFDDIPNEQTEPYFVLAVYNIYLPWILDEPFPARPKRETLLDKIKRLFRNQKK